MQRHEMQQTYLFIYFKKMLELYFHVKIRVLHFHREGVFIGVSGTSTGLERSVWRQVVARRPSHVADRPGGVASTNFLHRFRLLLLV
jgi:hypothetical protein